jgi:hypothetical protein
MNARLERLHCESRRLNSNLHGSVVIGVAGPDIINPEHARHAHCYVFDESVPRELYPAKVETEEEAYRMETPTIRPASTTETADKPDLSSRMLQHRS